MIRKVHMELWVTGIVILLGTLVRCPPIEAPLWYDELLSATFAIEPFQNFFTLIQRFDVHPPLYYLQLKGWLLLGTSDWWLRMNSVLAGGATLVSLAWVMHQLYGRTISMYVTTVMAILPVSIYFSQSVRMYSFVLLGSTWVWYFNSRILQGAKNRALIFGYVVASLITAYLHAMSFLVVIVSTVSMLTYWHQQRWSFRQLRSWLVAHFTVTIFTLPWIFQVYSKSVGHMHVINTNNFVTVVSNYFALPPNSEVIAWVLVGCIGFVTTFTREVNRTHQLSAAISFFLPLLAVVIVSVIDRPLLHVRTLIPITLPLVVASAFGIEAIISSVGTRFKYVFLTALILIGFYHGVGVKPRKSEIKLLVDHIRKNQITGTIRSEALRDGWTMCWYLIGPRALRPNSNIYCQDSDIKIVAGPTPKNDFLITRKHVFGVQKQSRFGRRALYKL